MSGFDWVKARSDCTAHKVFEQLQADVKRDLDCFTKLHPGPAQSLEFEACGKDRFHVGHKQSHRVVFERQDKEIHIVRWAYMGEATPLMVLTASLDDDGKCVLIDEEKKALKPWQARRKALEETLFGAS